jgi:hypothetical protein
VREYLYREMEPTKVVTTYKNEHWHLYHGAYIVLLVTVVSFVAGGIAFFS